VVLSFCAAEVSAAANLKRTGYGIYEAWRGFEGVSYASVQAFKGLEAKVVILTDVVLGEQEFHRDLFYTGMTRATEAVRVLCSKESQETLLAWINARSNE
jgi:superfamily I DNA/RNA helicase